MLQKITILSILFLLFSASAFSQSKEELERKKKKTQEEIKYINNLLNETKKDSKNSLNKLQMLNKKITLQERLISGITMEIRVLDNKINSTRNEITTLEAELQKIKTEYAKMIYYAYVNRSSYDKLMFIMSSEDFNQAYKRLKYFQYYSQYRQQQADLIKKTKTELSDKIAEFERIKQEKQSLIGIQQVETEALTTQKVEQNNVLKSLKSKEGELKDKLKKQVLESENLKKQIAAIIAEETRKAAERARLEAERLAKEEAAKEAARKAANKANPKESKPVVEAKPKATTTVTKGGFSLTPDEAIISDNFGANKGRLPWPTERGVITSVFGSHPHPVLTNIMIQNNGVDITTSAGATARAIFGGEVSKIVTIGPSNKAVLIRHGNFFTLYSNLKETYVKQGNKVTAKQSIGVVNTQSDEDDKTILHLEIWQESVKQDPSLWLKR